EDGIRDGHVTGVQTCALPIFLYEDFVLAGARGRKYRPLPVVPIDHDARNPLRPTFASVNFFVGPRYHDVYPSLPAWERQLPRDRSEERRVGKEGWWR